MTACVDTRNTKVFLVFHHVGLLCKAWTEATDEPISEFANTTRRGCGGDTYTIARVVAKQESFAPRYYLTREETADLALYSAAVHAQQEVRGGIACRQAIKRSHVWQNLCSWVKVRDRNFAHVVPLLGGAGWWRRGISGNKVLCELAALIRCLDRCDESDTSPFADADNGQEECDRTCTT